MSAGAMLSRASRAQPITGELEALAHRLRQITARVHTRGHGRFSGVGAGVVWTKEGLVVTNAHVVPDARGHWPIVELADGRSFEARLAARDEERDLALLVLERAERDHVPADIGDARRIRVGQLLVAIGHPFGVEGSLSIGIVHALRGADDAWLRADIRLAPGNSGGPLATLDGAVVGINSMVVGGLGVAVPAYVVEQFVRDAMQRGSERPQSAP